jgi:glycerophosphoryl diester phosphodiesterase
VAPENTIAAFEAALRISGCDGIEFDVRAAADGVPIVLHDQTLQRIHGVAARADELTAGDLEKLGVPTLDETLARIARRAFVDVELKEWVPGAMAVLEAGRGTNLERAVISSFDEGVLASVQAMRPGWPTWLNSVELGPSVLRRASVLGCRGISAEWHSISRASLATVAAAGLDLAAWTVRRGATYQRLERMGTFAICAEAAALDG